MPQKSIILVNAAKSGPCRCKLNRRKPRTTTKVGQTSLEITTKKRRGKWAAANPEPAGGHHGKLGFGRIWGLRPRARRIQGAVPWPPRQVEERRRGLQDDGPGRHWEPDRNLQRRALSASREDRHRESVRSRAAEGEGGSGMRSGVGGKGLFVVSCGEWFVYHGGVYGQDHLCSHRDVRLTRARAD